MISAPNPLDFNWDSPAISALVRAALDEDLRAGEGAAPADLTADSVVPAGALARARIVAKQELVLAGLPLAERIFRALDPAVGFTPKCPEGSTAPKGATVAEVAGQARPILSAERTALNFLGRLSGIATLTRRFVEAIAETRARIRDTRKTTPLLRQLEKYAVRVGGGTNHRFGLYDAVLIKENHIALAGGFGEAIRRAVEFAASREPGNPEMTAYESFRPTEGKQAPAIQVEVRNEAELRQALAAGTDSLLLDNLFPTEAARLIALARRERPDCVIEVSGGVNLSNVRAYAEAGADFIAIGALTHSAPAADLSLLVEPPQV